MLKNNSLTAEKLLNYARGLDHGLMRVSTIIDKVRSYSKGSVNRDQKLNLFETITNARDSMSQKFRQSLAIDIRVNRTLLVLVDQLEIELLFNNLFSNAVSAAITSSSPFVTVTAEISADKVAVQIENSGKNVSEQDCVLALGDSSEASRSRCVFLTSTSAAAA